MANSIQLNRYGPEWPLGFIEVITPGTPVCLMFLVDPNNVNRPGTLVPPAGGGPSPAGTWEYSPNAKSISFTGIKPGGGGGGTQPNAGNVYICLRGVGAGTGNREDMGAIVLTIAPGETKVLGNMNDRFDPYAYFVDADNAGDGVFPVLEI